MPAFTPKASGAAAKVPTSWPGMSGWISRPPQTRHQSDRLVELPPQVGPATDYEGVVIFMAHALTPDALSTRQIDAVLGSHGSRWFNGIEKNLPPVIEWFRCPIHAGGRRVQLRFMIAPLFGVDVLKNQKSPELYAWLDRTMVETVNRARHDGARRVVGAWGAYTKVVTDHGRIFVDTHKKVYKTEYSWFASTDGDPGTTHFIVEAMRKASIPTRQSVAILGAAGAIGGGLSRSMQEFAPRKLVLVGKDNPDSLGRLQALQTEVQKDLGSETEVLVHTDMHTAANEHDCRVVLVATNSRHPLSPANVPQGSVVLDTTTPAACLPEHHGEWKARGTLVFRAGCCEIPSRMLPHGFGYDHANNQVWDRGAGGRNVLWGCTGEAIANALTRWEGHHTGSRITSEDVRRCSRMFWRVGIGPQPPEALNGRLLDWREVQDHVQCFLRGCR